MSDNDLYYFDEAAADRVCRFYETQLLHVKGPDAGKPFRLLPWERKILRDVFGTKRKADQSRRYHVIYCEVPRKQGKTFFVSGLLLFLFCADGEQGAEVYAAACTSEQSGYAFKNCKQIVQANPLLRKRIGVYQHHLEHSASNSILKGLSGESVGSHGKNIHGLSIDEFHEWRGAAAGDLYDALTTSFGARRNYLTCIITTAGHGGEPTLCRAMHDKAVKYLSGEIRPDDPAYDDTFYPVIYAADPNDPWDAPATWYKANPSLDHSVPRSYLESECKKAKESPAQLNRFLRLYLNRWTEQATRWQDPELIRQRIEHIDTEQYAGKPIYLGIDTSRSYDLSAVNLLIPHEGRLLVKSRIYMPIDTARRRSREEGINFMQWIEDGYIIGQPGNMIDTDAIEADVFELAEKYEIIEVAYDPDKASPMARHFEEAGLTAIPIFQNSRVMSVAAQELDRRIKADLIRFDDNPVLEWSLNNCEVQTNKYGGIHIVKPNQKGKYAGTKQFNIDPAIATVIGLSRAMLRDDAQDNTVDLTNAISFV